MEKNLKIPKYKASNKNNLICTKIGLAAMVELLRYKLQYMKISTGDKKSGVKLLEKTIIN